MEGECHTQQVDWPHGTMSALESFSWTAQGQALGVQGLRAG